MMISGVGRLLSDIGIFLCVGTILLVALAFLLFRLITGPRTPNNQKMWNQRGPERPRYERPDIDSSGGFGGIPSTGWEYDPPKMDMNHGEAGDGSPGPGQAGPDPAPPYDESDSPDAAPGRGPGRG